jgi:hypothetical protein
MHAEDSGTAPWLIEIYHIFTFIRYDVASSGCRRNTQCCDVEIPQYVDEVWE